MSKTNKDLRRYLGYKFYKVDKDTDEVHMIRIIKIGDFHNKVTIYDYDKKKVSTLLIDSLSEYIPLTPIGFITFNKVEIKVRKEYVKDVIITLHRNFDVKLGTSTPYAVCRQNITDFFYNLIATKEDHGYVGVSTTAEECPTNIPYQLMVACDKIDYTVAVNIYIDDTLQDVLYCINHSLFDEVMEENYVTHMSMGNKFYNPKLDKRLSEHGWCRTLKQLLEENNFINDVDNMRNVTAIDFDLSEFLELEDKEGNVYSLTKPALLYFSHIFKINAVKTMVIKYFYDIDMSEFNNSKYTLLRDNQGITYIVVYITEGEYLEVDIENELNKLGVGDRIRLEFANKYSN